jgi:hypothetical protein
MKVNLEDAFFTRRYVPNRWDVQSTTKINRNQIKGGQ